jgi:hypothetical protein
MSITVEDRLTPVLGIGGKDTQLEEVKNVERVIPT